MGRATLIGFSAVAMWALLALLTDASGAVPPFLLSAITFSIGTGVGLVARLFMPAADTGQKIPPQVWVIGIAGLFGYHFFYFTALRNAPAVEASLIAYLWPLLIVLGSALMPGERLRWNHVVGALLGLAGTVLIVTKGGGLAFDAPLCLRLCHGRRLRRAVVVLFAVVAALSVGADQHRHLVLRGDGGAFARLPSGAGRDRAADGAGQWLAVLGLGLMPVGAAFYAWDIGVKRGNIQVLGAASYAAPLLSTLVLIARRLRRAVAAHPRRLRADHRRGGAGGEVAVPAQAGRPGGAGQGMMPFPGGIDANANATLIFSLVAAVIYAFTLDMPPTLARSAAKTLAVAMLAVLACAAGRPAAAGRGAGAQRRRRRLPVARRRQGLSRRAGQLSRRAPRLHRAVPAQRRRRWHCLAPSRGAARSRWPWRCSRSSCCAALWRRVGPGLRASDRRLCRGDPGHGHFGADARAISG